MSLLLRVCGFVLGYRVHVDKAGRTVSVRAAACAPHETYIPFAVYLMRMACAVK